MLVAHALIDRLPPAYAVTPASTVNNVPENCALCRRANPRQRLLRRRRGGAASCAARSVVAARSRPRVMSVSRNSGARQSVVDVEGDARFRRRVNGANYRSPENGAQGVKDRLFGDFARKPNVARCDFASQDSSRPGANAIRVPEMYVTPCCANRAGWSVSGSPEL